MASADEVDAAEAELRRAMLAGDVGALDRLLDDALIFTALDGSVVTKADDLALHRSRQIVIEKLEPSERRVAIHGDCAVVSVKMAASAVIAGQRQLSTLRYTRFWRREGGSWRVVGGHMCQL